MNQPVTKKNTNTYHVSNSDMPVSCPTKDTETWDLHPRVYLEFDDNGEAMCQYCGNQFFLKK